MEEDDDARRIFERERHQIEQIRLLDFEELLVEEAEEDSSSDDDDHRATGASSSEEFTFNTSLASLHTYLGEVDDTSHRLSFLNGGAILTFPLFYIEDSSAGFDWKNKLLILVVCVVGVSQNLWKNKTGVVLFPEATLPLRVIQPNFIAAVERALSGNYSIAVVRVFLDYTTGRKRLARIGTTAKIRQYRRLEDGSLNVLTRGEQRFRLKRHWFDVDGVPLAEVQIIEEDSPLRTPRNAFPNLGLGPRSNMQSRRLSRNPSKNTLPCGYDDSDSEVSSDDSFESELSPSERRMHQSAIRSCYGHDAMDGSTSTEDLEKQIPNFSLGEPSHKREVPKRRKRSTDLNQLRKTPRSFWPYWVYRMYDSYSLAQRAADMWKQVVKTPSMEGLVNKPGLLSFYIASKIPVSDSVRQELLEIDGISYRLQREIELLESFDRVRCRTCQTVFAKRSDMLVMSNEGPLGAYVNPHGFVHEIMTLLKANGLALIGQPVREYSWFPGYAWTIATCATCEIQLGWLFTATTKKLKPKSFWGIRSSQVADEKC